LSGTATILAWLGAARESDRAAARAHAKRANRTLLRFWLERRRVYAAERDFSTQPFWRRRAQPELALEPAPV